MVLWQSHITPQPFWRSDSSSKMDKIVCKIGWGLWKHHILMLECIVCVEQLNISRVIFREWIINHLRVIGHYFLWLDEIHFTNLVSMDNIHPKYLMTGQKTPKIGFFNTLVADVKATTTFLELVRNISHTFGFRVPAELSGTAHVT